MRVVKNRSAANPFDDPALARRYQEWYATKGRRADILEKELLGKLLRLFPRAHSVLEVGCGTGHFTRWLAERGLDAVGVDISEPMLNEARRMGGPRYLPGDAHALPFADRSYDVAALITTLEFVADPARALAEAVRVARQGLLLGVLNRWSLVAARYRSSGKAMWKCARFFGAGELALLAQRAAGPRAGEIVWRTTLWPIPGVRDLPLPWGGFIGMAMQLREESNA
ncbi:MAG TPA: class I SAM-dependent methyltransferase [Burkholderiales bacterium]|nr:class I SAM-dependent methyltransferase [Burkholderiales bacterium]